MQKARSPNKKIKKSSVVTGICPADEKERVMGRMKFEQFTDAVVERIREFLPVSYANAGVQVSTVRKNNNMELTALTIRSIDKAVSPTIYLDQYYDRYMDGADISNLLEKIADIRVQNELEEGFDIEQITDFDRVRDHLVPRLSNIKWNSEVLKERPYTVVADLAVTYHILLGGAFDGEASVPASIQLMKSWDVSVDTLHVIALKNLSQLLPSVCQSMKFILGSLMGAGLPDDEVEQMMTVVPDEEIGMFVLTNTKKMFGASALLDQDIMNTVVDRFGADSFYILPSSVHEIIIVQDPNADVTALKAMVEDVNGTQVELPDRLSDGVYKYNMKDGLYVAC